MATLIDRARQGDRRSLARALSVVEAGGEAAQQVGADAGRHAGAAYVVGITGAPGAGKSTLTGQLVGARRRLGDRIAVLAIDPSSPFSGGAILGDRVRMQVHATDDGAYIRSMATRGHLGGLTLATPQAVRVLDAAGYPWVVVETVGVGQVEVDIAGAADTTVVVVNPGWGDAVQANKAGLLEIADIFVINKADRDGAEATRNDLEQMLMMGKPAEDGWIPPVLMTVSTTGQGADELWAAVEDHRTHCEKTGLLDDRRRRRVETEMRTILVRRLEQLATGHSGTDAWRALTDAVATGAVDPYTAVERLLDTAGLRS
ncbi:MAG TPA: methylmalonyl Co-A mutase-associated GTPase MeaB [Acidimicrobiia bacterium]|nr:methylmalonyl Co-A mutase-associated GTPase MeaB [Acidimicrobiia bacterium]